MKLELPDTEATANLSPSEARLELACALNARGRVGKVAGTELTGVDFFAFQRALGERGIATVTEPMLSEDIQSLQSLFPK
jgi:predicted HTH domain antitoxin